MGVEIEATYEIEYYSSRDDGSSDSGIYWTTVFENKKYTLTHDYDDGYGNSESQSATLIDFVVKVNGQQIYKSANTPENGKIYNGYRIKDYDDGYGNSESQSATLIDFVVKVNGQQIYKSANTPENGKIYNGYRIKYTSQNIRP